MAYGEKYTFRFDSQEGKDWMVVIFEEGYTGTPVSRCVGGHPLLRMESNGCIRGMSLELPAECVVADEYADLYTSDPVRFKVSVYLDHDEVWQGFITPELYSAPWVDPPHDVALTATDGLGELKRQNYSRGGRMSLATHLGNLLAATGLSLPIRMVSSLESDVNEPEDFLTGTLINLDHLSGETMYDALQAILASIHATVRQSGGSWLLIRETDISGSSAGSDVEDTEGDPILVVPFGSMRTSDVWPVGRLTSEIVPARNSVTVTSDNESDREFLDDPDMTEGSWDGDATHSSEDGGYYQMAVGESISQEVTMPEMPSTTVEAPDMRLKVTARQADTAKAHNIRIKVSSYMYLAVSDRHETYWLSENSSGELVWTDVNGYLDREIPAAAVSRSTDCTSIEMVIPVTRHSQREERKIPETVTVEFASDDNTVYVHAASLGIIPQWAGIETRVTIDNGARGGDSPVGVMFADSEAYNRGLTWMSNCAYGLATDIVPIHTLASGSITAAGTGVFLAQDYAMSVANPRLSLKGVLQIPSGAPIPVFLSTDGIVFIAEEWSYDLFTDELDVSMLSLPAVEIEVEDVTQESYSEKGGGGTRASASSGGSAPSTPQARTLDWFIAETYTEDNTTKQRLRLNPKYQGMYADGWVSAGGISETGQSGAASYLHELLDVDDNLSPTIGQALVWDGAKWTADTIDPGTTVTQVKVGTTAYNPNSNGVVSLPAYLPLTGGTMSGHVTFEGGELEPVINFDINRAVSGGGGWAYAPINIRDAGNSRLFNIGVFGGNADLAYAFLGLDDYNGEHNLRINASGLSWGSNTVWHQGNDGSGSGLDADTVDGKHNGELSARACGSMGGFGGEGDTVADCKTWLAQKFSDSALGVGDNCFVSSSFIFNWDNDSAVYDPSSVHSFIKIGGGYDGVNYGQWLLSSFATNRIGYVGRSGNQWTDIKWLANTEDIDSCVKLASPNNLIHSGNEFTFIPPNFSNGLWLNYRTSDYSLSGAVTEYNFGDGAGHALASITQGQFSGNAATATKLFTARTIWGQSFDGTNNVDGILSLSYASTYRATGIEVTSSNNDEASIGFASTNRTVFGRYATRGFVWSSVAGEIMSLLDNGNVGVGVLAPSYKLDVAGDLRTSGKVYIGTTGGYLEVVNVGTQASPSYALRSTLPFFSDSWVSAGGVGTSGGGSTSYLNDLLDVTTTGATNGQALVYNNGTWSPGDVESGTTQFVFAQSETDPGEPSEGGATSWTATSNVNWITLSKASGSGSDTVSYTVSENTGASSRTGVITIAYQGGSKTLTVTQAGASSIYTEVEYITCDGNQYLDTGRYGNEGTTVTLEFMPTSLSSGQTMSVFGYYNSGTDSLDVFLSYGSGNTRYDSQAVLWSWRANTEYAVTLSPTGASRTYGSTTDSESWTASSFTTAGTMMLGYANVGSRFVGRLYSCKIWQGSTLVMDLVPVLNNNTGEYGMYDNIGDDFLASDTGNGFGGPS